MEPVGHRPFHRPGTVGGDGGSLAHDIRSGVVDGRRGAHHDEVLQARERPQRSTKPQRPSCEFEEVALANQSHTVENPIAYDETPQKWPFAGLLQERVVGQFGLEVANGR